MTSQLKQKIQSIIRRYFQEGKADRLNTEGMDEIRRAIKKYGVEKITATELKPMVKEVQNELHQKFTDEHLGAIIGQPERSAQTILDNSTYSTNKIAADGISESKKIDRRIIDGVKQGIDEAMKGDADWRDVSRVALRKLQMAEHHIETNINTVQGALDNAARFEQFKLGGVKVLEYAGTALTKRDFCAKHVGKFYPIEVAEKMINSFGQRAIYYVGGWGCRHRWRVVNEGEVSIEKGTKNTLSEIETAQALKNAGMSVRLIKKSEAEGIKTHDSFVNDVPAEFKDMTDETVNQTRRARDQFSESIKQGAAHFVLKISKHSVNMIDINEGIARAIKHDSVGKIKKITVIINNVVQTITREEFINGKQFS